MTRRDLLLGTFALVGSAAAAGGGTAYALSTFGPSIPGLPGAAKADATRGEPGLRPSAAPNQHAAPTPAAVAAAEHGPAWDYEGAHGPASWGELDAASAVCQLGGAQSPIDLADSLRVSALPGLPLAYGATRVRLFNNGHTIQVNVDKGSSVTLSGKRYELVQFHFHTPSEHTLDGRTYPLELHLVHQAADKNLAVVAVLMNEGAPSTPLLKFWDKLPRRAGEVDTGQMLDVKDLLPRHVDEYLTYAGSLTTPPCTENVRWIVLRSTVDLSKSQVAAFRAIFRMNARPTQPIGARVVLSS